MFVLCVLRNSYELIFISIVLEIIDLKYLSLNLLQIEGTRHSELRESSQIFVAYNH